MSNSQAALAVRGAIAVCHPRYGRWIGPGRQSPQGLAYETLPACNSAAAWQGQEGTAAAQQALLKRCHLNRLACDGKFHGSRPMIRGEVRQRCSHG